MDWDPADRSVSETYHFLASAVAPRPIAWVTTQDTDGRVNAAPFSWYQSVCADPPLIMLALADRPDGSEKDTLRNARAGRELVVNMATVGAIDDLVASSASYGPGVSEVEALGLQTVPSRVVAPPRLAASPVALECRVVDLRRYGRDEGTTMIVAEVVHIVADDGVLDARGNVDPTKVTLLARLGGRHYAAVREVFDHERPPHPDAVRD